MLRGTRYNSREMLRILVGRSDVVAWMAVVVPLVAVKLWEPSLQELAREMDSWDQALLRPKFSRMAAAATSNP